MKSAWMINDVSVAAGIIGRFTVSLGRYGCIGGYHAGSYTRFV